MSMLNLKHNLMDKKMDIVELLYFYYYIVIVFFTLDKNDTDPHIEKLGNICSSAAFFV